jgi:predicted nucleotidyltransferase
MTINKDLNIVTRELTDSIKDVIGDALRNVILYGSYARGDHDENSDIDIMILSDIKDEDSYPYLKVLSSISNEIDLKYNVFISVILQNKTLFESCLPILPFYQNVIKDGVELYAKQ